MKRMVIFILILLLMLQSCYSYKKLDLHNTALVEQKIYKVKAGGLTTKGKLISSNDSIVKLKVNKSELAILISDIEKIRKRKLSILKTFGLTFFIAASIALAILGNLSTSGGEYNFNWY